MSSDELARVGALLRQAESTDNPHEADAFLTAAQRIATARSIDLAVARAHTRRGRNAVPVMRQIHLGEPGTRGLSTYVLLFVAIARANDVRVDAAHDSSWVVAFGFATDINTTRLLYTSLVQQMVRASAAYLRSGQHRRATPPVAGVTARIRFQEAFAARVGDRLRRARDDARGDALARAMDSATGTAIALRSKNIAVRDFHREHSAATGTWRGGRRRGPDAPHATAAGDRAGRTARLGTDPELGTPPPGLPS
ncbi:DUF2786 domain-containing protein [Nocardia mexicana]|uniref:Uncharacterized protein DUF2786 n=1 Tax=Nocardia mexicana TaxID=279262 RepID=A0A370GPL2_9NOCA|nr:DUF2786 domain-containing protein [Nocardia mexicana]RDI45309.1 uncharacterized protein DUF2786 [Nocardia mexicana]